MSVVASMSQHALIVNIYFDQSIIELFLHLLTKENRNIKKLVLITLFRAFHNKPQLKDTFAKTKYTVSIISGQHSHSIWIKLTVDGTVRWKWKIELPSYSSNFFSLKILR